MLLADLTSVKTAPMAKMMEIHQGAVVGLHPMFGPDIASMAKQVIAVCEGRYPTLSIVVGSILYLGRACIRLHHRNTITV